MMEKQMHQGGRKVMGIASKGYHAARALLLAVSLSGCVGGIDATGVSPISNDETFATLGYMWGGVRSAIANKREPFDGMFTLPLSYQLPCTRGGQGAYQGTLAGTKTGGAGSAALAMTAALSACQFDENVKITTLSASGFTVTGTVAIANDAWGAISIRMIATSVTVNGKVCPGGVDVMLTGTTPFVPPISTGTACGRTGAVALP